jgi:hypothetical protein
MYRKHLSGIKMITTIAWHIGRHVGRMLAYIINPALFRRIVAFKNR